jgi:hypothetical protein
MRASRQHRVEFFPRWSGRVDRKRASVSPYEACHAQARHICTTETAIFAYRLENNPSSGRPELRRGIRQAVLRGAGGEEGLPARTLLSRDEINTGTCDRHRTVMSRSRGCSTGDFAQLNGASLTADRTQPMFEIAP